MKKKFFSEKHYEDLKIIRGRILFTATAFLAGLFGTPGFSKTAKAAELTNDTKSDILITELGVSQEAEGIFAYCTYQEFNENKGMMQLYLERMDEQGQFLPVSYADLDTTGGESKTTRTNPEKLIPGIYKAVLLMRGNAGTPVIRFRDSDPYEVKRAEESSNDKNYQYETAEPPIEEHIGICEHIFTENVLREADPDHDAILAECCQKCGHVFTSFEIPNSAYAAFLKQSAEKIRNAPPDDLLIIETNRWVSFNKDVLDAIAARRDLFILIEYRYQGFERQAFIPPGADITEFADENGFCGFSRMAELLAH